MYPSDFTTRNFGNLQIPSVVKIMNIVKPAPFEALRAFKVFVNISNCQEATSSKEWQKDAKIAKVAKKKQKVAQIKPTLYFYNFFYLK